MSSFMDSDGGKENELAVSPQRNDGAKSFKSPGPKAFASTPKPNVLSNGTTTANVRLADNAKTPAVLKSPITRSFAKLLGACE